MKSEHIIQQTEADVLLILDCCDSGTLSHRDRGRSQGRTFELLAACEHDKVTRFPGMYSFTSALIWALEQLAEQSPFSTAKLKVKISEAPNFPDDQNPLLHSLGPVQGEHIVIKVLGVDRKSQELTTGLYREELKLEGDYVDIRFHYNVPFDRDHLVKFAVWMKSALKNESLDLRRIAFLRKGNTLGNFRQVAATWLSRVRTKASQNPQAFSVDTRLDVPQSILQKSSPSNSRTPTIYEESEMQSTLVDADQHETDSVSDRDKLIEIEDINSVPEENLVIRSRVNLSFFGRMLKWCKLSYNRLQRPML